MGWRRVARFLRVGKDRAGIRSGGGSSGRRNCRGRRDEANSAHRLTESLHYPLPRTSKLRLPLFLYPPPRLDSLLSRLASLSFRFEGEEEREPPQPRPSMGAFAVLTLSTDRETIRQDRWKFRIRFVNFNITGDLRHARVGASGLGRGVEKLLFEYG